MIRSALLIFAMFSTSALAIGPKCDNPITRTDKMQCLISEVNDIDIVLRRTYWGIVAEVDKKCGAGPACVKIKESLWKAELAWMAYRDSFCELESIHLPAGDKSDFQYAFCLVEKTRDKTEELRIQQLSLRQLYRKLATQRRLDELKYDRR